MSICMYVCIYIHIYIYINYINLYRHLPVLCPVPSVKDSIQLDLV